MILKNHRKLSIVNAVAVLEELERCRDAGSYSRLLDVCGLLRALKEGKQVHAHIQKSGFEGNVFLSNHLVRMYGRCGSLEDASNVFNRIYERNVFSWTAMVDAYARKGLCKQALILFQEMQLEGQSPDPVAFVTLLNSCAVPNSLPVGKIIHTQIRIAGFESHVIVGTAIVSMYGRCGNIKDAQKAFHGLPERNMISWSAIIAANAQHGYVAEALILLNQMHTEGPVRDNFTYTTVLNACCSPATLPIGKALHLEIKETGLEADPFVGTALLDMYRNCGSVQDAQDVFHSIRNKDVVAWSAMIATYAEQGYNSEAYQLFREMQLEGMKMDGATFVGLLNGSRTSVEQGQEIEKLVFESGLQNNTILANALISMHAKCGCIEGACRTFNSLLNKSIVSWNAMISAYIQHPSREKALDLFQRMQKEGPLPDNFTFAVVLTACDRPALLAQGRKIHAHIVNDGFESDHVVGNALVDMYSKCGSLDEASDAFEKMEYKDLVSWTSMVAAYVRAGYSKEALHIFNRLLLDGVKPDELTLITILYSCPNNLSLQEIRLSTVEEEEVVGVWTRTISWYAQQGNCKRALLYYRIMLLEGLVPVKITFLAVFKACTVLVDAKTIRSLHLQFNEAGIEVDPLVGNVLMDLYGKCGSLDVAKDIFDRMSEKPIVSWSVLLATYGKQGYGDEALRLFRQMQVEGLKPDTVILVNVLSASSHAGLLKEGCCLFGSAFDDYGVEPVVELVGCIVSLLARTGKLQEAEMILKDKRIAGIGPQAWMSLLGACRDHCDLERGKRVADSAMYLKQSDSAPYVILSNIYEHQAAQAQI